MTLAKLADFQNCEICGDLNWQEVYRGRIRDGSVGKFLNDSLIAECRGCGVQRLSENFVIPKAYYETDQYRKSLQQHVDSDHAYAEQDWSTRYIQELLWPTSVRNLNVADIGCGVGSFLDNCIGQANKLIAIEPCEPFQELLRKKGFNVFKTTSECNKVIDQSVDLAISIQVIEHVSEPVKFLGEILPLLSNKGELLITTPNRNDILGSLIPDSFLEFFYRSAHRWYFNIHSLEDCAR